MWINKQQNREKGIKGEEIACDFLISKGYLIKERNYRKKWGEIDIIAVKDKILHFIEVKSVSKGSFSGHRPEENVNNLKVKKLRRIIQTYLNNEIKGDMEFKFHVITVEIGDSLEDSVVNIIENVIL